MSERSYFRNVSSTIENDRWKKWNNEWLLRDKKTVHNSIEKSQSEIWRDKERPTNVWSVFYIEHHVRPAQLPVGTWTSPIPKIDHDESLISTEPTMVRREGCPQGSEASWLFRWSLLCFEIELLLQPSLCQARETKQEQSPSGWMDAMTSRSETVGW